MHWLKKAKYLKNYELIVEFEDGTVREVDLKDHLNTGVLSELKNIDNFKKFKLNHDTDTVEWENGADLSPDYAEYSPLLPLSGDRLHLSAVA